MRWRFGFTIRCVRSTSTACYISPPEDATPPTYLEADAGSWYKDLVVSLPCAHSECDRQDWGVSTARHHWGRRSRGWEQVVARNSKAAKYGIITINYMRLVGGWWAGWLVKYLSCKAHRCRGRRETWRVGLGRARALLRAPAPGNGCWDISDRE